MTINRTAGKWFAYFYAVDRQEPQPVKGGPTIGDNVGVGTMATYSVGSRVENPKTLARALQQQRRMDQAIARSRYFHGRYIHSCRREWLYARGHRLHMRNGHHLKPTTLMAKSAGQVVVLTLNVAGMMENRRMARTIGDTGMSRFLVMLE